MWIVTRRATFDTTRDSKRAAEKAASERVAAETQPLAAEKAAGCAFRAVARRRTPRGL